MAIDLKFSKTDASSNWGFRVVGGADFQQPLIVVKVNENSLADQAGLQKGDIILKINELSTSTLTHSEVQQAISSAGLQFTLGIKRGEVTPSSLLQDEGKEIEIVMRDVQVSVDESIIERAEQLAEQLGKEIFEEFGKHKATKLTTNGSEERMVFSNSTQTFFNTEDKYKQKKWSTFLMKPERPPAKPRKVVEEQKRMGDGYKIIIQKQSRRKSLPKEKRVQFDQNVLEIEHVVEDSLGSPEVSVTPELGSYESQPDLDSLEDENFRHQLENYNEQNGHDGKYSNSNSEQCSDSEIENNVDVDDENSFEHLKRDSLGRHITYKPISEIIVDPYSENAMTLEEQLRTVQKQLQALSQLPSSVQETLDAVSKQIADIFIIEKTENENKRQCVEEEEEGYVDGDKDKSASTEAAEAESGADANSIIGDELEEDSLVEKEIQEIMELDTYEEEQEEDQEDLDEINRIREEELEAQRKEEELLAKKEKEMEKRATFRPIVLPGGRKWIDPDDVVPTRKPKMSDEKIMESIENSLEVISGKRKGLTNGTTAGHGQIQPNHSTGTINRILANEVVDARSSAKLKINFMKYTPPARNLDYLQRSEVYRLIHDGETTTTTRRGIVARPEKILPEQDYYEATKLNQ